MSNLSSRKKSLRALPPAERLSFVLELRLQRRNSIISAAQTHQALDDEKPLKKAAKAKAVKGDKKVTKTLATLDADQLRALLALIEAQKKGQVDK